MNCAKSNNKCHECPQRDACPIYTAYESALNTLRTVGRLSFKPTSRKAY